MTPNEKTMIVSFLRELSSRQGHDGCNDLELPNTPENVALCAAAFAQEVGEDEEWEPPGPDEAKFYAPGGNWMIVDYLAGKLEAGEQAPGTAGLHIAGKPVRRWIPSDIPRDGAAENITTVEALRGPCWESSLVYGTLARMGDDGMPTNSVYAETKETGEIDLRIVINGHEYPALAWVERWRNHFDYCVAKEARELVTNDKRVNAMLETLRESLDGIDQGLYDVAIEAFPHADLERDDR
jgi:hypothetical protein